jgi:hypothetical protein
MTKKTKNKTNKPSVENVYSLETLVSTFIPSADFDYDNEGQIIIYTNLYTDDDGNLLQKVSL